MVKKFTANCDFGGRSIPVTLFVGDPSPDSHPLAFQNKWLGATKGGSVPNDIMESFAKLKEISIKNKVSFEELCGYVIEELKSNNTAIEDAKKAKEFSDKKNDKKDDKK